MNRRLSSIIERAKRATLRPPRELPEAKQAGSHKDNPPDAAQPDNPVDSRL